MSDSLDRQNKFLEQAHKLRELMLNYEEFLPSLEEIMREKDPRVIKALLSVVDFPNLPHQMFAIIHAVESFSQDIYIPEFISSIEAMSKNSLEFLDLMVLRILNNPDDCRAFAGELKRSTNKATKTETAQALKRIASENSEFQERCDYVTGQMQ